VLALDESDHSNVILQWHRNYNIERWKLRKSTSSEWRNHHHKKKN